MNIIENGIVHIENASCGLNDSLCEHFLVDMMEFTVQKLTCTDEGAITKLKAFENLVYTGEILAKSNLVEKLCRRPLSYRLLPRVLALWIAPLT